MRTLRKVLKTYKGLKKKCFGYISDEYQNNDVRVKKAVREKFSVRNKNLKFLKKKGIKTKGR